MHTSQRVKVCDIVLCTIRELPDDGKRNVRDSNVAEMDRVSIKGISKVDRPGTILSLTHWNCWYGSHHKSTMRLMTAQPDTWTRPGDSDVTANAVGNSELPKKHHFSTAELIAMKRKERERVHMVSCDEHEVTTKRQLRDRILPGEIDACRIHEEDQKLYPGKYQLWRFQIADEEKPRAKNHDDMDVEDSKPAAKPVLVWKPYFRLSERQRRMVEMKLGHKISVVLSTRWPGSTVDTFAPDGKHPVV